MTSSVKFLDMLMALKGAECETINKTLKALSVFESIETTMSIDNHNHIISVLQNSLPRGRVYGPAIKPTGLKSSHLLTGAIFFQLTNLDDGASKGFKIHTSGDSVVLNLLEYPGYLAKPDDGFDTSFKVKDGSYKVLANLDNIEALVGTLNCMYIKE